MKSIILFLSLIILTLKSTPQNLPKPKRDSITFSINLLESANKYATHGECYIQTKLTNNTKNTVFYVDDNNMALANYVTANDSLWIVRGDFAGGPRPVRKALPPDSSINEKIAVFGFKNYTERFKIGFDLIMINKRENIAKKATLLYKKTHIIWSNSIDRIWQHHTFDTIIKN